jgi:hypothetical protein
MEATAKDAPMTTNGASVMQKHGLSKRQANGSAKQK